MTVITDITPADHTAWLALWNASNNNQIGADVTAETWSRLLNPIYGVHGVTARAEGKMIGIAHYVLHPTTGNINPAAYMQDLYVDPAYRRRGIAKLLVEHLAAIGAREKWARLYWLAEGQNAAAQALYRHIGLKLDFSFHVMPLGR